MTSTFRDGNAGGRGGALPGHVHRRRVVDGCPLVAIRAVDGARGGYREMIRCPSHA